MKDKIIVLKKFKNTQNATVLIDFVLITTYEYFNIVNKNNFMFFAYNIY